MADNDTHAELIQLSAKNAHTTLTAFLIGLDSKWLWGPKPHISASTAHDKAQCHKHS